MKVWGRKVEDNGGEVEEKELTREEPAGRREGKKKEKKEEGRGKENIRRHGRKQESEGW